MGRSSQLRNFSLVEGIAWIACPAVTFHVAYQTERKIQVETV